MNKTCVTVKGKKNLGPNNIKGEGKKKNLIRLLKKKKEEDKL